MSIYRISDEHAGDEVIAVTEDERETAIRAMFPDPTAEVTGAINDYLAGGDNTAAEYLGITETELDPDDRDDVDDDLWGRWLSAHLIDGRWQESRRDHALGEDTGVLITIERPVVDGRLPGGPVQVRPFHGSRERSWIKATGWGDVRLALDAAREAEREALAAIRAERAADRARFDAVRAAHHAVLDAEAALARARQARREAAAECLADGASMYRIAREVGTSDQAVAKWVK